MKTATITLSAKELREIYIALTHQYDRYADSTTDKGITRSYFISDLMDTIEKARNEVREGEQR